MIDFFTENLLNWGDFYKKKMVEFKELVEILVKIERFVKKGLNIPQSGPENQ